MKQLLIKFLRFCLNLFLIGVITLILFECCYRFYVIDFYGATWKILNQDFNPGNKQTDMLVFGDSFSAKDSGYVYHLRKQHADKVIYNASFPGIGLKQVNLFASARIKETNPKAILYQVYTGNDLTDVKNLTNWSNLPAGRNIYWSISDYLLSLKYINQQLAVFSKQQNTLRMHLEKPFDPAIYDKRTLLYLQADAAHLEKVVSISDDFSTRYTSWKKELEFFLGKIPKGTKVFIVFIPHCTQVNNFYLNHMKRLGARVQNDQGLMATDYMFYKQARSDFKSYPDVVFLNPLSYLQETDREGHRLYYENDPHFNQQGHEAFATYLSHQVMDE